MSKGAVLDIGMFILALVAGAFLAHLYYKGTTPQQPELPECAGAWRQMGFAGFVKGDTVQFSPMFECIVPEVQQGPKGKRNGLSVL